MKSWLLGAVSICACALGAVTVAAAAPVTYKFVGQVDTATVGFGNLAVPGDSWLAFITFDDSVLISGNVLNEDAVLGWQLTVPTDPRFDLGDSTGDTLLGFTGAFDLFQVGSSDMILIALIAENTKPPSELVTWSGLSGDLTITAPLAQLVDEDAMTGLTVGSPVPITAAAWLFGSGLLGLIGVARRKAA